MNHASDVKIHNFSPFLSPMYWTWASDPSTPETLITTSTGDLFIVSGYLKVYLGNTENFKCVKVERIV